MSKTIQDLKMKIETLMKHMKGDNPGVRKPRKEISSQRCKYQQQNARDKKKESKVL